MKDTVFLFTRLYDYQELEGQGRHFFFEPVGRTFSSVSFLFREDGNDVVIEAPLQEEEGVECCTFELKGTTIDLYSDCYIDKDYSDNEQLEDDRLRDVTIFNNHHRELLESADKCGCYACCRIFHPKEIEEWTDNNATAICPYCGVDAIIPTPTTSILKKLNEKYFTYD